MSHHDLPAAEIPEEPRAGAGAPFAPAEIAGITPPMVGRDADLQRLVGELYAMLAGGPARLITVVGPAGIGKSRLAHEFCQMIARLPEPVQVVALQPDQQSTGQPYSLFRLLVAALFRIREGDHPAAVTLRLEHGVAQLLGPGSEEKAHCIGQLAGYEQAGSPHLRGALAEPRLLRDRALHFAAQCLAAFTATAPLVLLIDNLHYADDSSLDALVHLVAAGPPMAVLVVGLAQQRLYERRPDWGDALGERGARLDVAPLDERDGRRLVAEILRKAGKLPTDLRNLIVSRADGNPFYVEELIKMLIADGVVVPGPTAWTVQQGRLSRLRVPATLGELLRARTFALAPAERDFLLRAAVVGRSFWAEAALALGGAGEELDGPVERMIAGLEARDLIALTAESRFPGQHEYVFRHELLHEVAYGLLPADQRAAHHRRAAAWLIERAGERAGAYAAMIAEHFERGDAPADAGAWYVRAGRHALETYALDAALARFQAALALLPDTPEAYPDRVACHEGRGQAQLQQARISDAVASYTQMAALAAAAGDRATEAWAWSLRADALDNVVDYAGAEESARRAISLAESAGNYRVQAYGIYRYAFTRMRLEQNDEALALAQQALTMMEAVDEGAGAALCKALIGMLHESRNDFPAALRYLGESLAYNRSVGNLSEVAAQLNNLGFITNARGDYPAALAFLREGLAVAQEIGSRVGEIYVLSNIGFTLNGLGAYEQAEAETRRGIGLSELSRVPVFAEFHCALAESLLGQGRVTEAVEAAQQALDVARAHEGAREVAYAWRALGRAISAMSDSQGAPACFAESARLFAEIQADGERGRALRAWAEHELRRGDHARGRELWAQARAAFAAAGLELELGRTPDEPPYFER
jgi:predicted ATPase